MDGDLEYIYNGLGLEVCLGEHDIGFSACIKDGGWEVCTVEEAIDAARAILKHFNVGLEG